jgi:hypothetical protein
VLYIDTDTTFTAYLTAGLILKNSFQTLDNVGNSENSTSDRNNYKSEGDKSNGESSIIDASTKAKDERIVQVFLPSEGRFESLLGDAIASMPEASIVIFDSLNSFYNMYPGSWYETEFIEEPVGTNQKVSHDELQDSTEQQQHWKQRANQNKTSNRNPPKGKNTNIFTPSQKPKKGNVIPTNNTMKEIGEGWSTPKSPYTVGRLNHLLSIFIMLLVQHGIFYKIPVLVTSMVRYKKVSEDIWVKAPACSRLLNQKSVVRLSIDMLNDNDLSVNIMKHPSIEQQTIVYPNVGISLVSP